MSLPGRRGRWARGAHDRFSESSDEDRPGQPRVQHEPGGLAHRLPREDCLRGGTGGFSPRSRPARGQLQIPKALSIPLNPPRNRRHHGNWKCPTSVSHPSETPTQVICGGRSWPKAEGRLQRRFAEKAEVLAANLDYNAAAGEDRIDSSCQPQWALLAGLDKARRAHPGQPVAGDRSGEPPSADRQLRRAGRGAAALAGMTKHEHFGEIVPGVRRPVPSVGPEHTGPARGGPYLAGSWCFAGRSPVTRCPASGMRRPPCADWNSAPIENLQSRPAGAHRSTRRQNRGPRIPDYGVRLGGRIIAVSGSETSPSCC